MTEFRHDPNSLADRLDQLLPPGHPDQIGRDADPLIEAASRLASAPRPSLSPDRLAHIQSQVMRARPVPQRAPMRLPSPARLVLAAVLSLIFVAGAVFAAQQISIALTMPSSTPTTSATATHTATATPTSAITPTITTSNTATPTSSATMTDSRPPTATDTPTAESPMIIPVSPTLTHTAALSPTNTPIPVTLTPTFTATPMPNETLLPPTFTPTPTSLPVSLVVEGPIQSISTNIIVIYDIEIVINPADPILTIVQVGDFVRIGGNLSVDGSEILVIAVTVTVVNVEVNVSPQGDVWRDSGDCSNPPPTWAPALGWRARCEGGPAPGNSDGMGMGEDDDD